jgi:alkylation response protein AidB-like acyl-CoA dehydrogenase
MSNRISQRTRSSGVRPNIEPPQDGEGFTACPPGAAKRLVIDIRELASAITARAGEMEAGRHMPRDMVEILKAIGAFRLFVPHSHGGLELDLPSGLAIITALARVDGSVGWNAMIGNGGHLFAALLPRQTYDQLFRGGPDVVFAGVSQPAGTAEATEGGFRVSGRWAFASGCRHADWLGGVCVMTEGGKRLAGPDGKGPLLRGFFMPAHDWEIEDTWHVAGLKGTGSHHIIFKDKVVPAANFFDLANGESFLPGPLYRTVLEVLPLFHGAFAVGLARGALDELIEHAGTGRQQLHAAVPMRDSETFQYELGRIEADLRAAEAFHRVQTASYWRRAVAGTSTMKDPALFAETTQAGIWIATACVRVVDGCFALAGGSAVYDSSPLQRRLRDMHTAAQHATVHQRHYVGAGKLLLDPPNH